MKTRELAVVIVAGAMGWSMGMPAQGGEQSYANAAMTELQVLPGTRLNGAGRAGAAGSEGLEGLYWNPAGLGARRGAQVEISHTSWFGEVTQESLGAGVPWGPGALGVGVEYLNLGSVEAVRFGHLDEIVFGGEKAQLYGWGLRLGYGAGLGGGWRVGGAGVLQSENLGGQTYSAVALNAGVQYHAEKGRGWRLGGMVKNVGPGVRGHVLPQVAQAGAGYEWEAGSGHRLTGLLEAEMPLYGAGVQGHAGVEYVYREAVAVRAGYTVGEGGGVSAGAGYHAGRWSVGYAFAPVGSLGVSHRVSVGMNLGQAEAEKPAAAAAEPFPAPEAKEAAAVPAAEQVQEAAPEVLEHKLVQFQQKINVGELSPILFKFGKAIIETKALPTLDYLGKLLEEYSHLRVRIEGHTDNVGNLAANRKLSERRVNAVRQHLIENFKLDGNNLIAVSYGMKRPMASNETPEGRKKNRRVEFHVIKE